MISDEQGHRSITTCINGRSYERTVSTSKHLGDFIREDIGLTGTHIGCEHGVCGVCTISFNGEIVRSCLMLAVQSDGAEIVTIEGVGPEELHPVQQAFWDKHGLQCGFCTPAMVLTAVDLIRRKPDLDEAQVREALSGNLCRCTGYQFIVDAVLEASKKMRSVQEV